MQAGTSKWPLYLVYRSDTAIMAVRCMAVAMSARKHVKLAFKQLIYPILAVASGLLCLFSGLPELAVKGWAELIDCSL